MPSYLFEERKRGVSKKAYWMCDIDFELLSDADPKEYQRALDFYTAQGYSLEDATNILQSSSYQYGCCKQQYHP